MSDYPTPSAYQEAIQFPEDAFRDPALQQAVPDENALGLPQAITGHFAAVFPMTGPHGTRWAVKCFLTDVPDQQARYAAIAEHLAQQALPYTVEFAYQPEGIRVDGAAYPILKMAWVEGMPLNRFVEAHLDAPEVLTELAEAWAALLDALHDAEVAHGDLQHGNVLVRRDDGVQLTLVDYDAMVVPGLNDGIHSEVGHRNYQHPDRTEVDSGLYLDRFPGLVVFTALRACAAQPALWSRFDTGENLLFRAADFYDPSASVLFDTLTRIDAMAPLVDALRTACYMEPETVPRLVEVRDGTASAPAWYEARPAAARRRRSARANDRSGIARWFLPALLAVGGSMVVLLLAGAVWLAVGLLGGAGAVGGWISWRGYRQVSIVRRHRRLVEEIAHLDTHICNLERQIDTLRAQRKGVQTTVDARRARRLDEVQDEALYDRLKHHFIGEVAGVEGVTHKHVVRLKKASIRTAYEATPERLQALRTIGEKTTARITMWRNALVARYEDAIPNALSPAEERRIQRYIERRVYNIDDEIARTRDKVRVQEAERARVQERMQSIPAVSFARYLCYLLRLDTLPRPPRAQPHRSSEKEVTGLRQSTALGSARVEEKPWWAEAN